MPNGGGAIADQSRRVAIRPQVRSGSAEVNRLFDYIQRHPPRAPLPAAAPPVPWSQKPQKSEIQTKDIKACWATLRLGPMSLMGQSRRFRRARAMSGEGLTSEVRRIRGATASAEAQRAKAIPINFLQWYLVGFAKSSIHPTRLIWGVCPASFAKIFPLFSRPKSPAYSRHPAPIRGAFRDRHGRGAGCGGRGCADNERR